MFFVKTFSLILGGGGGGHNMPFLFRLGKTKIFFKSTLVKKEYIQNISNKLHIYDKIFRNLKI